MRSDGVSLRGVRSALSRRLVIGRGCVPIVNWLWIIRHNALMVLDGWGTDIASISSPLASAATDYMRHMIRAIINMPSIRFVVINRFGV